MFVDDDLVVDEADGTDEPELGQVKARVAQQGLEGGASGQGTLNSGYLPNNRNSR